MAKSSWPDEAVELLRVEWNAGSSGQACADAINEQHHLGVTRNAAIGKAHRLGLPPHPTAVAHSRRQQVARLRPQLKQTSQLAHAPLLTPAPAPADVVYYKSVPFFELESHHCRYAVSGDNGKEYQFCGNDRWQGSSYCAEHTRVTSASVIYSSEGRRFAYRRNFLATERVLHTLSIKEESETP